MKEFLESTYYVDYTAPNISQKVKELFTEDMTDIEKAEMAFYFVRDEIPHSFDCDTSIVTAKASEVLKHKTGICHAKSNLLAALLRSQGIPTGFRYQHLTLADDDSLGYCLHCYNAVFLEGKWIELDARGNKEGVNAQFSLTERKLAFMPREEYEEYFIEGIFTKPDEETMKRLESAKNLGDVICWNEPGQLTDTFFSDLKKNGFKRTVVTCRDVITIAENKVHVKYCYYREGVDGKVMSEHDNVWIVTWKDGKWGIQLRSY